MSQHLINTINLEKLLQDSNVEMLLQDLKYLAKDDWLSPESSYNERPGDCKMKDVNPMDSYTKVTEYSAEHYTHLLEDGLGTSNPALEEFYTLDGILLYPKMNSSKSLELSSMIEPKDSTLGEPPSTICSPEFPIRNKIDCWDSTIQCAPGYQIDSLELITSTPLKGSSRDDLNRNIIVSLESRIEYSPGYHKRNLIDSLELSTENSPGYPMDRSNIPVCIPTSIMNSSCSGESYPSNPLKRKYSDVQDLSDNTEYKPDSVKRKCTEYSTGYCMDKSNIPVYKLTKISLIDKKSNCSQESYDSSPSNVAISSPPLIQSLDIDKDTPILFVKKLFPYLEKYDIPLLPQCKQFKSSHQFQRAKQWWLQWHRSTPFSLSPVPQQLPYL